jgi:chromosome segregation ATPase
MHEHASVVEVVARRISSLIADGEARLKSLRDETATALIERDAARAQRDTAKQEHSQVRASIESMNRSKEAFRKQLDVASGTLAKGKAA